MRFIYSYLKKYRGQAILAPLFKMLVAAFELIVPLVVKSIIDVGLSPTGTKGYVLSRVGVMVLLAAVGLCASITAQYFSARAAVMTAADLRADLMRKVTSLSRREQDRLGTATLLTRLTSDIEAVQNGVNLTLRLLLRSPFVVFGAVAMAFTVDVPTALVFAAALPVLSLIIVLIMRLSTPLYRRVQGKLDDVTKQTRENLTGARVIRAFNREAAETRSFREKTEAHEKLAFLAGKLGALMNPLTLVTVNAAVIALLWLGGGRVNTGRMTPGAVAAQYNYLSQILVELIKLANLIVSVSKALASAKRIEAVFAETPAVTFPDDGAKPDPTADAVTFRHVTLQYHENAAPALTDVTFTVKAGEKIGVIGATGAGKSSLVSLIGRAYDPTHGTVRVMGQDARDYDKATLTSLVATALQKPTLFAGTIRENLCWGCPAATDEDLLQAAALSAADDVLATKDAGLDAEVEQDGRNFSGGQRQRLALARAVAANAPILILDDALSALDNATGRRVLEHALALPGTLFLISQRVSHVRDCDRILVLEDGRLTAVGTHDALLQTSETYRFIDACERGARS